MDKFDPSRRDSMRKMIIAGGACVALSQVKLWNQPQKALTGPKVDDKEIKAAGEELALTTQEQDVFAVIKKNLMRSKNVTDEQIGDFSRRIVAASPEGTDFKQVFSGLQNEFHLMEHFIRYIHA
ncbi:DUF1002 domain-containing protein [Grimontia kaedaensis]|uniref:DUF1002 domain-containing protein n=1 Tax=Grimontia kaedaensis TaxID=2872157 RepID=A0ABY4WNJ3_9GAMM|nr:DUF1002 domain-containing protein [Grimontia kaedaensis]USH01141.1 DUF1002 domain-containing protein [Grimontia kaedaensis]